MELILVRHAKAESRMVPVSDEERALTPKGRAKAEAAARGLRHCLRGSKYIQVWASPALRSRQTAEIIADTLGVASLREHPSIYAGSLEELLKSWSEVDPETSVVVVGHEPHLGIWAKLLANVHLPFKKCSAAAFNVNPSEPSECGLKWFAIGKVLAKMGEK